MKKVTTPMERITEQMKDFDKAELSEKTRNFMRCLVLLETLYSETLLSVQAIYGEDQGTDIIGESFHEPYEKLNNVLAAYLADSIRVNQFGSKFNKL